MVIFHSYVKLPEGITSLVAERPMDSATLFINARAEVP
jgi:hypothetical protein